MILRPPRLTRTDNIFPSTTLYRPTDPAPPPASYIAVSGGLFKDMAIHDFDMARWLLGEEPATVYAAGSCLVDPEIGALGDIDTARTVLTTASGRLCVISNRSEEHTSELQSLMRISYAVFCLKKKKKTNNPH